MNEAKKIADTLLAVARLMVDQPDDMSVIVMPDSTEGYTIEISGPYSEMGKLIGKYGHTARSLRSIVSAMAMTAKIKISLNLAREIK
jgi:predicted RNA-binding protein YlqC (UPF0109 family)